MAKFLKLRTNKILLLSLIVFFAKETFASSVCSAQKLAYSSLPQANHVALKMVDLASDRIVLKTTLSVPAYPPQIQYLPGANGQTVMVCDFFGLNFDGDSKEIAPEDSGLLKIRIGQFQQYPPIFRLSFVSLFPSELRKVSFSSKPGAIVVKWGSPAIAQEQSREIAQPPEHLAVQPLQAPPPMQMVYRMPPRGASPTLRKLVPYAAPLPDMAPIPGENPKIAVAQGTDGPPCTIAVFGTSPLEIKLSSPQNFSCHSFRLTSPSRYVCDFSGLPEHALSSLPQLSDNQLVKSLRAGFGSNPGELRLVLDLVSDDIPVKCTLNSTSNVLSILVSANNMVAPPGKTLPATTEQSVLPGFAPQIASVPQVNQPLSGRPVNSAQSPASSKPQISYVKVDLKTLTPPANSTVVLDAGHGGSDPGAERGDIQEKDITLGIIEKLKSILTGKGIKVSLTRSDDTFVSLQDRVDVTNKVAPDLFLSVHINSLETTADIHGIETYYQNDQSKALAEAIHGQLVAGLNAPDRGVRRAHFYVINHTPHPAVLAEVGFISNKEERDKLISSDYQKATAEALASGVILFLNKEVPTAENLPKDAQTASPAGSKDEN